MISLIVAMSFNHVIGKDGGIPWHLPAELKLFKSLTMGHHIIMGRRTYESIGRLLPGRHTVIVTRNTSYHIPGAVVVHSLREAIAACGRDPEIFVIGGAEIFEQAIALAHRIYLSVVQAEVEGDTYMPRFARAEWKEVVREMHPADARNQYAFEFTVLDRV